MEICSYDQLVISDSGRPNAAVVHDLFGVDACAVVDMVDAKLAMNFSFSSFLFTSSLLLLFASSSSEPI